jgi:hypothetical protein
MPQGTVITPAVLDTAMTMLRQRELVRAIERVLHIRWKRLRDSLELTHGASFRAVMQDRRIDGDARSAKTRRGTRHRRQGQPTAPGNFRQFEHQTVSEAYAATLRTIDEEVLAHKPVRRLAEMRPEEITTLTQRIAGYVARGAGKGGPMRAKSPWEG